MASTVWRGNIAFGLVSIPVRLVRAARRERIQFHHVYRPDPASAERRQRSAEPDAEPEPDIERAAEASGDAPVQRVRTTAVVTQEMVTRENDSAPFPTAVQPSDILKGYEVEPNRYVTFQRQEMKALKPETSTAVEIASFIHLEEVDPLYFDASYYVVPQPAGEKPYAVLFGSLQHTGLAALGKMAMHGREHNVVIRTGVKGLILETLFYRNEVHLEDQHATDPQLATASELKMADAFIKALSAKFNPEELVDQYEQRLKTLIEQRAQSAAPAPASKPPAKPPVLDIMDALRKSLEQIRKPAAKETSKRRRAS